MSGGLFSGALANAPLFTSADPARESDRPVGKWIDRLPGPGIVAIACLVALYGVVVGLKVHAEHGASPGFLKEEFALQYRYARMIALGDGIPWHDRMLQSPEGVHPHQSLPLFMEHL